MIVLICVGLGSSGRQKYICEVLRPELRDTTRVWLAYQQKQQTSDSAHSNDTPATQHHLSPTRLADCAPLLLGRREGGREAAGWRVNGWLGRQVT